MSVQRHCLTKCRLFDEIYLFLRKQVKPKESKEVIAAKLSNHLFDKINER